MDPRFAFMLGTGRCGSTIVFQTVAMHPDVGFVSNLDDRFRAVHPRGRFNNAVYRSLPTPLQKLGGQRGGMRMASVLSAARAPSLIPSEGYRLLEAEVSPMLTTPVRDLTAADAYPWLSDRLRRFFDTRAQAQGKQLFAHKFTGWPRAGLLHDVFPEARFVHIVRDGRAVASSLLQQRWWDGYLGPSGWTFGPLDDAGSAAWEESGRSFAVLAALEWKRLTEAFAAAREAVPAESWLELRYEDVVAAPRDHFPRLLEFLGLDWSPAFERAFAGVAFTAGRREAFRDELSERDVAAIEALLAPELSAYGYEVA